MNLEFGKDKTAVIKGIAIVFMIVLHCAIPSYWDIPLKEFSNEKLTHFKGTFKLCVGIFTFMVGYGYAFSKAKDFKYSLIHIWKLLLSFWIILIVFTLPFCFDQVGIEEIFLNLFGIESSLNWFSWFVTFYIYAMIIMPFYGRLIDRNPLLWSVVGIVLFFICEVFLHEFYPAYKNNVWLQRLFDCLLQSPCMILGYLFARQKWFLRIHIHSFKYMSLLAFSLIVAILILRSIKNSILGFNLDFFYAPAFIFLVLIVFNRNQNQLIFKVLTFFGNISVYMWFFHALFFTKLVRNIYQPFVAISDSLWIVTFWTIIITSVCSWGIMTLVNQLKFFLRLKKC